jgi:hypothetical protein
MRSLRDSKVYALIGVTLVVVVCGSMAIGAAIFGRRDSQRGVQNSRTNHDLKLKSLSPAKLDALGKAIQDAPAIVGSLEELRPQLQELQEIEQELQKNEDDRRKLVDRYERARQSLEQRAATHHDRLEKAVEAFRSVTQRGFFSW